VPFHLCFHLVGNPKTDTAHSVFCIISPTSCSELSLTNGIHISKRCVGGTHRAARRPKPIGAQSLSDAVTESIPRSFVSVRFMKLMHGSTATRSISDLLPVVNGEGLRPSGSRASPDDGASRTASQALGYLLVYEQTCSCGATRPVCLLNRRTDGRARQPLLLSTEGVGVTGIFPTAFRSLLATSSQFSHTCNPRSTRFESGLNIKYWSRCKAVTRGTFGAKRHLRSVCVGLSLRPASLKFI
jgi:hypothetical protein